MAYVLVPVVSFPVQVAYVPVPVVSFQAQVAYVLVQVVSFQVQVAYVPAPAVSFPVQVAFSPVRAACVLAPEPEFFQELEAEFSRVPAACQSGLFREREA